MIFTAVTPVLTAVFIPDTVRLAAFADCVAAFFPWTANFFPER